METRKRTEGQTLIETALMLFLLLLILLGITEFSRAWYTKNSLKNAARSGARVAVVTPATSFTSGNTSFSCTPSTACPNGDVIINAVCCQPGVPKRPAPASTTVTLTCRTSAGSTISCSSITSGDEIMVIVTYNDPNFFVVGNSPWPWPKGLVTLADASMRYE